MELLISRIVINEGVARGCGIKYQNHPCPLCTLLYPIGRETEYLICVALVKNSSCLAIRCST